MHSPLAASRRSSGLIPAACLWIAACGPALRGPSAGDTRAPAPPLPPESVDGNGGAAQPAGAVSRAVPGAAAPLQTAYAVRPGDLLRINVLGHADLCFQFRVPSEGFITFPLIGKVAMAGRPSGDIEREIRERLEQDYLVNPQVSLFIEAYSKKYVYVFGGVKESRAYEIPEGQTLTLTQVLSMAGGFSLDAAKDRVRVIRRAPAGDRRPAVLEMDVTRITEQGDYASDPPMDPGDVVVVPSLRKIYVLGQVQRPSGLDVTSDRKITVTQAISLAGGFTSVANEREVRVLRRTGDDGASRVVEVDVWAVVQHGRLDADFDLEPGDIVFVPESLF